MKRYTLTESRLRGMIREAVKDALMEQRKPKLDPEIANELLHELGHICYQEESNTYDFTVRASIRNGKFYLYFTNNTDYPDRQDTKNYAKDFIRRNKIFSYGVLDIEGFDQEDKLWVRLYPNDNVELRGLNRPQ